MVMRKFEITVNTDRYCFHGLALSCLKVASVSALCKPFAERWDGDDPQLSIPLIFLASVNKIYIPFIQGYILLKYLVYMNVLNIN